MTKEEKKELGNKIAEDIYNDKLSFEEAIKEYMKLEVPENIARGMAQDMFSEKTKALHGWA